MIPNTRRRVTTLRRLMALAELRRCVSYYNWDNPCPAAVVIGMPAHVVWGFMRRGLYEYKPKGAKRA